MKLLLENFRSFLTQEKPQLNQMDILHAMEEMCERSDMPLDNCSQEDFKIQYLGELNPEDLALYDDLFGWVEFGEGDLVELPREDAMAELSSYRGENWAQKAIQWLVTGIPPVIIIEDPQGITSVGDGRGRTNFAIAFNKKLPVYYMEYLREG